MRAWYPHAAGMVQSALQSAAGPPMIERQELPMTALPRLLVRLRQRTVHCYELFLYALLLALALAAALAASPAAEEAQCGKIQSSTDVIAM
jgi:hypothetical protein